MKNNSGRRKFIESSVLGLGSISVSPLLTENDVAAKSFPDEKKENKLNILCVGAHPGDPEFGCGGTMTKYSQAGNNVTFLYLTRGEAYNDKQSYAQSAALRTKEAEKACDIIHAKPLFAGQIDGNTELNKQRNEETAKLILSLQPDIVFTHWPLDAHPDHQVSGLLAFTAWVRSGKKFHLYFYEVNTGGAFQIVASIDVNLVNQIFFIMTKEQLIASVSAHYDELAALNQIGNFYDYESDFIKLWAKMGREVLEKNISTLPGDRRKKNSDRIWGADNSQKPSL